MNTPRKGRIEELEGQIKDELDRRINIQVSEFRKRANILFKGEEYEIFKKYLNSLLEKSDSPLPDEAEEIIKTLKSDEKARAIFSKLQDVLRLKEMAIEVSKMDGPGNSKKIQPRLNHQQDTIYLPPQMPVTVKKTVNTPDDLREAISDLVADLSAIIPDPGNWLGWMIFWLETMDKKAIDIECETDFEQTLERLIDMISNRLYNKHW